MTPSRPERTEIWIVEDEESLLEFMKESLEMEGYVVRAFAAPTDLLEVLQPGADEQPNLLLLDVALPEMSGPELLEEIHQRGWRPKVLWSSGYRSNARLTEKDKDSSFLQKPYTPGDLVDAVRKAT
jgi:two-component system C4-dicarboxylate transport response regulator DctD